MAGRYDYIIDQGRTWRRWVELYQDRAETVPVPLTDFTAKLEIARVVAIDGVETTEEVLSLTTENGGITITGGAGKIEWIAEDADTADLEGEYFYELFIVNTLGESTSIMKGLIQVSPARAD